jgi:hypothetical protein
MGARARWGVSLLLLFGVLSAANQVHQACALDTRLWSSHLIRAYDEDRLARVKPFLSGPGPVGYVHDDPEGDAVGDPCYLAQYVLAPTLVVDGPGQPLVVVDGRPGRGTLPVPPRGRLRLLRDLGDGVRLCRLEVP